MEEDTQQEKTKEDIEQEAIDVITQSPGWAILVKRLENFLTSSFFAIEEGVDLESLGAVTKAKVDVLNSLFKFIRNLEASGKNPVNQTIPARFR